MSYKYYQVRISIPYDEDNEKLISELKNLPSYSRNKLILDALNKAIKEDGSSDQEDVNVNNDENVKELLKKVALLEAENKSLQVHNSINENIDKDSADSIKENNIQDKKIQDELSAIPDDVFDALSDFI